MQATLYILSSVMLSVCVRVRVYVFVNHNKYINMVNMLLLPTQVFFTYLGYRVIFV